MTQRGPGSLHGDAHKVVSVALGAGPAMFPPAMRSARRQLVRPGMLVPENAKWNLAD
jgi:hypothetical protein